MDSIAGMRQSLFGKVPEPDLVCPKCGDKTASNDARLNVSLPDFEASYCIKCYCAWIAATIPKLQPISPATS